MENTRVLGFSGSHLIDNYISLTFSIFFLRDEGEVSEILPDILLLPEK